MQKKEWNMYGKWEVQTRSQIKFKFNKNTAPYFVSHLDSMSSHKLTLHSHYFVSFLEPMQRLCHPVPYGPMQRLCHPAHFFQSHLTCYLSLCTSATQLMCEPCNVLQSGPRFDFIQLSVSFWNLCSASAIQFHMDLCNAFAIQPISFSLFCCMSKPSQFNFFPWHESSNLDNDFVHHAQIQNIQIQIANLKSHTPSFAFHSEPHANAQTTLPLYSSLRILCKVPLPQISSNSMPAFW